MEDGRLLGAGGFKTFRVYDIGCASHQPIINLGGFERNVTSVGFNDRGPWLYSGGEDGLVRVLDPRECSGARASASRAAARLLNMGRPVNSVTLAPSGTDLVVGAQQSAAVTTWCLRTNRCSSWWPFALPSSCWTFSVQCVAIDSMCECTT